MIRGDIASATLNGQPLFERPIEPNNPRTFGFFRYAGATQSRVRNVTYRGSWPKSVPASLSSDR